MRWTGQATIAAAIKSLGLSALGLTTIGSVALFCINGVTPATALVKTATSETQGVILWASVVLGLLTFVVGMAGFHRMMTRETRAWCITGLLAGIQGAILAGGYLVFRQGVQFDIFVEQFFSFNLLAPYFQGFVNGMKNTILLAFWGEILGLTLGVVLALVDTSSYKIARAPARIYIDLFRGTPLLLQLVVGYFGVVLGLGLKEFGTYNMAILILGLNAAAYTAEVFRSGILAVPVTQIEASRSIGLSYLKTMAYVVLPQAFRVAVPPLTNAFVVLVKDTSLVLFLGLLASERELLSVGRDAYSELFNSTPLLASAFGYLVITVPLIIGTRWLERKLT